MCFAWIKQKQIRELTLHEIRTIFNDGVLKNNLEVINITGGEPTLRRDLAEIVKIILQSCLRLKRLDISTNGVNTAQVIDQIERVLALLLPTNVRLTVSISLDGVGEVHEQVRQTPGIFNKVEQTIDSLKELMTLYPFFCLGLNMTISRLNYNAIEETRKYAIDKGIGINFTLSAISDIGVESIRVREKFELNKDEKKTVASFMQKLASLGELDQHYAYFLIAWLLTGKRQGECAFRKGKSLLLEPNGDIYLCGNFKDFRIGNLLQEPLKQSLIFDRNNLTKKYKIKCETCNSNCYIDSSV
jgi:MoaA/NifB/PqqE/SkfB family radical SAM enzyme